MLPALIVAIVGAILAGAVFLWTRRRLAPPAPRSQRARVSEDPSTRAARAAERAAARAEHAREAARFKTAISTRVCPRCSATAIEGSETFQHSVSAAGGGGGLAYRLEMRCSACDLHDRMLELR